MFLSQYKTFKYNGVDVTEFDCEHHHVELCNLLERWLETYRVKLMTPSSDDHDDQHKFVFITRHGKPFAEG
jgi:hypothetical protein